jgi:hypothetical protein
MAFDEGRNVMVLFGGEDYPTNFGDTWEWDGAVWTQRSSTGPPPRKQFGMAYDSSRGKVVLYGGYSEAQSVLYDDMWEWDGASWSQIMATGPGARDLISLVEDKVNGGLFLYGGSANLGDMWKFVDGAWHPIPSTGPPDRFDGPFACDPLRKKLLLFAGRTDWDTAFNDTWEFELSDTSQPKAHISALSHGSSESFFSALAVTFSEPVTGLAVEDFAGTGIAVSNLRGSGTAYVIDVTVSGSGSRSLHLPAGTVEDFAGNANLASNTITVSDPTPTPTPVPSPTPTATPSPTPVTLPPFEPVALAGPESVTLLWNAPPDVKVAGYNVYRRQQTDPFVRLTPEPIIQNTFLDEAVELFKVYEYQVTALATRNDAVEESIPSEIVEAVPGNVTVLLQAASAEPGKPFTARIGIREPVGLGDGRAILSFVLAYDPQVLRIAGARKAPITEGTFGELVITELQAGSTRVLTQVPQADPGAAFGRLLEVDFTLQPGVVPGQVSTLSMTAASIQGVIGDHTYEAATSLPTPLEFTVQHANKPGDIDGDGQVTQADLDAALQIALGGTLPTAAQLRAGDLNADQALTEADVPLIMELIAGSGRASRVNQQPPGGSLSAYEFSLEGEQSQLVRMPTGELQLRVPVGLNFQGNEGSLSARLVYDKDVLEFVSFETPEESPTENFLQSSRQLLSALGGETLFASAGLGGPSALGHQPFMTAVFRVIDEDAPEFAVKVDQPKLANFSGYSLIGQVPIQSLGATMTSPARVEKLEDGLTGQRQASAADDLNADAILDAGDLLIKGMPYPAPLKQQVGR